MNFKDFSGDHPGNPEAGMRQALNYTVTTSETPAKQLAAELDLSPSEFSRMITLDPSDDHYQRRTMPMGKIVHLMQLTNDYSPLATMLGYLGYDPTRLEGIRRDQSVMQRQLLQALQEVSRLSAQLNFSITPEPVIRPRRKRGAR